MKKIFIFMIMLLIALPGIAQHFSTVWTGSGYSHCNINILEAKLSGVNLEVGDEIAAFDGSICVGVVRITGSYTTLSIAASKAEPAGSGNGYTEGNPIILKYWDNSWNNNTGKEVTAIIKNSAGNDYIPTFVAEGSVFVKLSGKTELTITFGANNKTYDGDVLATVPSETVTALGVVTGQNVNVAVSNARFDTKEVGTGKTVTADVALSGTDAGYYTVSTTATTTANIVGKVITITPDANQHKVYGTTDPGLTYTASPALISPDVITGSLGRVTNENAGTYAFTMGSLSAGSNYTLQFVNTPATFTVEKRPATWTTNNNSKTYGESDPNPLTTGSGNFLGSDGVSATYTRVSGETVSGGPYAITATLASSVANALDNYTITNAGASFTIDKVNSSITATGSTSYTYSASAQGPASSTVTGSTGSVTYSYSGTGSTSYSASSTAPTNAGTYQVIASVAADANYNAATSAALAFTINKASSSITATGSTSYTYSASAQGPASSTVTGSTGSVTYSYSGTGSTSYSASSTAPTNAGTYQVIASVAADANYNAATSAALAFTINKASSSITATGSTSYTYSASAQGPASSTVTGSTGSVTYSYSGTGSTSYSASSTAPTNAGTYQVIASVVEDANFNAATSEALAFTINKASSSITATGSTSYTYSASAQGPASSTVTGSTGSVTYSYSGTGSTSYSASSTAPTNAGTYQVIASVAADANYNAATSAALAFTINKASSSITATGSTSYTYSASAQGPASSTVTGSTGSVTYSYSGTGSTSYSASSTAPTNAGTYQVIASVAADANYNAATSAALAFTINKASSSITATGSTSYTYSASAQGPASSTVTGSTGSVTYSYSGTGSTSYSASSTAPTNAGTYQVIASVAADANYNAATSAALAFTINKASSSITATGSTSYTYSASAQGPASSTVTGSTGSVTYSYSGTGSTSYSASSTAPTNAGTYQVIASVVEDANFNAATSEALAFTINKASSSITATGSTSYTYSASAQGPASSTVTGSTGSVTYSYSGTGSTSYSASSTAPTNAGTYQVIASVVEDANFNAATSAALAFTINKAQLTVTADSKSKTYDGTVYNMFTSTITGFVSVELVGNVVSGTVTYSGTAIAAVNAGHYNIVPIVTGLSATNYSFEAVNGELTINSPSSGGGGGGSSDTTPPVWVTASASLDRTIEYGDATGLAAAQALKPVASDASSFVLTKVSGSFVQSSDCIYAGTYTNTWTAKDSYGNISKVFTQVINIDKTYNEQPKVDQVNDLYVYKNSKEAEVTLSGIDPTSGCIPKEIVSLVAIADNSSLITNISVVYTKGSTSGKLVFKIADNLEGESLIKVTLRDNGGVASGASDTKDMMFKIKVVGEDQGPKLTSEIPVQIINPGNSFQFNLNDFFEANDGKPFTYTATLANGSSLPSWMVFNPQTGIISGVTPQNDLGSYQIFVTARNIHGLTNQTSFWMVNSTSGSYMVSGSISSKSGPVTGGIQVILLKIGDNNQTTIVEKINLNGSSSFVFSNLSSGNYLLNAVVTDVNKHPDLLNTYYNGSNSVYTAQRIELKSQSNSKIQLLMLNKEVFTSNGSISGLVIRKTGPAASGSTQTGVSAPHVDIVLKRDGKVVANTLTDIDGKYSFNSLPEGNYVVEVEQLGYVLDVNQKVIIAANNQSVENVNFTIWMTGAIITEVRDLISGTEISMFPNPTSGQLHIVSSKETKAIVSIMNSAGVEIFHENYISGTKIDIDLSSQISGLYIVKFESDGESVVRKIVLKK